VTHAILVVGDARSYNLSRVSEVSRRWWDFLRTASTHFHSVLSVHQRHTCPQCMHARVPTGQSDNGQCVWRHGFSWVSSAIWQSKSLSNRSYATTTNTTTHHADRRIHAPVTHWREIYSVHLAWRKPLAIFLSASGCWLQMFNTRHAHPLTTGSRAYIWQHRKTDSVAHGTISTTTLLPRRRCFSTPCTDNPCHSITHSKFAYFQTSLRNSITRRTC